MNHLKGLNPEQLTAVNSTDGPYLILAGPGTGKTQLLSVRTANIIKSKKSLPENILILTFSNAASKEMKERLAEVVGEQGFDVEVSTYHSFAKNYIILDSEEATDYIGERIQITDLEKTKAIEYILDNTKGLDAIRPFGAPYTYRREIEAKISELKNEGVSPKEFSLCVKNLSPDGVFIEEKHIPRLKALAKIYEIYEEIKTGSNKDIFDSRGRFDYDDMILVATEVLKKERALRESYHKRYKYIMVDEFQDSNGAQLELLFCLINKKNPNICCVGDDDQSIFRFQGANIGNFRALKKQFPKLKTISLKTNYRSTKEIIEVSLKIIKNIPPSERMEVKTLSPNIDFKDKAIDFFEFTTEHEELSFIVKRIEEIRRAITESDQLPEEDRKNPYNNIAVIVRKRDLILKVIDAFLAAGIPYATDGKEDIKNEKRVGQLLDVLDLAHINIKNTGAEDLALFKILSSDYMQIPMHDLLAFIGNTRKKKISSLLQELLKDPPAALKKASCVIGDLLQDARNKPLHGMLMQYIHDSSMYKFVLRDYDKRGFLRIRELRSLTSFLNIIKSSDRSKPGVSLDEFMEEIKTKLEHGIPIEGELVTLAQNGVRVCTAHSSKGHEFHSVFIPFCLQDKSWPMKHKKDKLPLPYQIYKTKEKVKDKKRLDQLIRHDDARLFYVASSRAKANLIFTASPDEDYIPSFYLNEAEIRPKKIEYQDEEQLLVEALNKQYEERLSDIKTNEAIGSIVKTLILTPTKVNNYLKCKRKFFYDDVLKLPGKKRQGLVFGNCTHKALEETYKILKTEDRFPEFSFFETIFREELKFQGVDNSIEKGCLDKLDKLKLWFELAKKYKIKPLELEKKILITITDDLLFTGKYDKVEIDDKNKGTVKVIDYKTGKPDHHIKALKNFDGNLTAEDNDYIRQLVCYKMLYEKDKTAPKKYAVSCGALAFLEPVSMDLPSYGIKKGDFVEERIALTDKMVSEMESIIKNTWADIQKLTFDKLPQRDNSKCGNCDFNDICWD